jgi:transcriptional accessory protein Tex/SPT6
VFFQNGKRTRKAVGSSVKKAMAELEANRVAIRGGTYREPRKDLFDDLADEYDEPRKDMAMYKSEEGYIKHAKEFFKGRIIQTISEEDVEKFKAYIVNLPVRGDEKRRRGAADINHHLRCLGSILKMAVVRDWITKNPAEPERVP